MDSVYKFNSQLEARDKVFRFVVVVLKTRKQDLLLLQANSVRHSTSLVAKAGNYRRPGGRAEED